MNQSTADLACRVVPGDAEDPVLAGFGVLRVAARFQGEIVDRRNRMSDGRLAIARMIGGDECSHEAHLALIELANGICGPGCTVLWTLPPRARGVSRLQACPFSRCFRSPTETLRDVRGKNTQLIHDACKGGVLSRIQSGSHQGCPDFAESAPLL